MASIYKSFRDLNCPIREIMQKIEKSLYPNSLMRPM